MNAKGGGEEKARALAALFLLGLPVMGCVRYVVGDVGPQAHYQTAVAGHDVSGQIEEAFWAVKRVQVTGSYDNYLFSPETAPLEGDALGEEVLARAVDTTFSSTARGASAVQIARTSRGVTLLMNEHPIHFRDTVVEYAVVAGQGAPGRRDAGA